MKLLLIGESCIDIFKYGIVERICPEAPCPVFKTTHEVRNTGMAANVLANLKALVPDWQIDFITNEKMPLKIRYVEKKSNHMLLREDVEDEVGDCDLGYIDAVREADCVIVSDYNKGFVSNKAIKAIGHFAKLAFIDSKKPLNGCFSEYDFIKINMHEAEKSFPFKQTITTAGSNGAYYNGEHFPVPSVLAADVAGAGDTFLAGLVVEYMKSKDIKKAIVFANDCANKVVQKRGVCTV